MAASRMCHGVTKSGSPTPSEITSGIACTMSKNSRIPDRGISRTCLAIKSCDWKGGAILWILMLIVSMSRKTTVTISQSQNPRRRHGSGGGLVLLPADNRFRFAEHRGARDGHRHDFVGAGDVEIGRASCRERGWM